MQLNSFRSWPKLVVDNITRDLLTSGTLKRYIDELEYGATSNPTIFDQAIKAVRLMTAQSAISSARAGR